MTESAPPLIQFVDVVKDYGGARPLRVRALSVGASDRVVISGLDEAAAETMVHLISGAALPDEGRVQIAGQNTRHIETDTEWLLSLDRFGIVTRRAVLLGSLSVAANLALPLTVSIEPLDLDSSRRVEALADEVGLARVRLADTCASLAQTDLVRLHLARALALTPELLLLEHPTKDLTDDTARADIGRTLRRISETRPVGWLAFADDPVFARHSAGKRWRVDLATGALARHRWWRS